MTLPRLPLGIKILALFLPLSLLPVAVGGVVAYRYMQRAIAEETAGVAVARADGAVPGDRLADLRGSALLVAGLSVSLALLGAGVTALLVVRPLSRLTTGTERIARGDFDVRVAAGGGDEISQLTDAFNSMAASLASYREDLVRAESAAAVGRLASVVAHEVRNPLNAIRGCVDYVRLKRPDDELVAHHADIISAEIDGLNAFVRDLLGFVRLSPPRTVMLDVRELLATRAALHEADARARGIALHLDVQVPCTNILGDAQQLSVVFENLANNAFDAMPEGGTLSISAKPGPSDVVITFVDTGAGMSPETLARLSTPFFTTKPGGTGLGLATCQRIVALHGGSMKWSSQPDAGATFEVRLPLEEPAVESHRTTR